METITEFNVRATPLGSVSRVGENVKNDKNEKSDKPNGNFQASKIHVLTANW
jgi:hypothetical protein